jgi:nucleotide-binding universal stress UspA family protein
MPTFTKILFPTDYSESAQALVPYVRHMVSRGPAELTVLHVLPLYALPEVSGDFMGAVPMLPMPAAMRKGEEERLAFYCAKNFPGLSVRQVLLDGDPGTGIEEIARSEGSDLVMMSTHGTGLVRRLLLGSVAAKVLHDLDCAVWTCVPGHIKPEGADFGYRSIVCALTSDAGQDAQIAGQAAALAREFQARLTLVHVVEPPQVTWDFDFAPYRDRLMAEAEERLLNLDKDLGLDAGIRVVSDMIPKGIREVAAEEHADLLIVGRGHSRQAIGRIWSQLYETVREAPCPVLSV